MLHGRFVVGREAGGTDGTRETRNAKRETRKNARQPRGSIAASAGRRAPYRCGRYAGMHGAYEID
ncbi:hypothetical protein AQ611_23700 [Burkholderia singularis]|nr:hypothetical protein AQ611_23700 [Burkholderia sp. Bp7605]